MEIIVILSLVVLLVLGALFVLPKSRNKGKAKEASSNAKSVVYDVTSYVEEHPGGDAILNNAGGDSTEGFFGLCQGFYGVE
uniref:Cytochrome b5 heme-binding domain-containing protein n=2 Tax=Oryza TaxID=4527 RepID=A0A0E0QIF8_ORYRU